MPKEGFREWDVRIRVSKNWAEDGFDLTLRRLKDMILSDLGFAWEHEIEVEILKAPEKREA